MSVSDEIRAKHVFGEMTLKDLWPLVSKCDSIFVIPIDISYQSEYKTFFFDDPEGLTLWDNIHDDEPVYTFPPGEKVKVKEDHVEINDQLLYFQEHRPIRIEIL